MKNEKKVEYIELIYDLIFVYIIGRNNGLLHSFSGGFVKPDAFMAYVMTTLAIIQIWNYSTYYINIYGRRSFREHVFLFVNMFLLYFVGEGTRVDWQAYHTQYHLAWGLILVNIGIQYLFEYKELRNDSGKVQNARHVRGMACILFAEAGLVMADIICYKLTHTSWLSLVAILFGICAVMVFGQKKSGEYLDFPHLSERAMLYVVFTFGEMIIAISSYFTDSFSLRSTYFALMSFLIVVGLFLSYGVFYDQIIDREKDTNGLIYMLLHIGIIFAMNNITNGLEFMREEEIALLPKVLFLVVSMVFYFIFLFALGLGHAKARCRKYDRLCLMTGAAGGVFILLMLLLRSQMTVNVALSVLFVFVMFGMIYDYGKKISRLD